MDYPQAFESYILRTLADHPDWLPFALRGISAGMEEALAAERERCSKYDLAFLASLGLSDPKRLMPATKKLLNDTIVRAINPTGASLCEQAALKRAQDV